MPYNLKNQGSIPSIYYTHKGKTLVSRVGSPAFDSYLLTIDYSQYNVGKIPAPYAHRPDLLANLWYGSPYFWWKTLIVNGLFDPFESLNPGTSLLVPKE